jgi:phage-related protein
MAEAKRLPAGFYRTGAGGIPVREWLRSLDKAHRVLIGNDIATVEFGWPIGMPACRPMGGGLYEVRTNLPGNRTARVLFCVHDERMILLHGFIKKTQETPRAELDLALDRKRKLERQT